MSAPGGRPRKLRLACALGVLLAALLVLIFRPAGRDAGNPVRVRFQGLTTNVSGQVEAVFVASNGWHREVQLWMANVQEKEGGEWIPQIEQNSLRAVYPPGEVTQVNVVISNPASPWRAELVWIVYPSRARAWSWNVRAAVGRVFPAVDPDRGKWFNDLARTNRWPETAR